MGLLHFFLELEIWQTQRTIFVSQQPYVKKLLEVFGMDECKPISTLMDPNMTLSTHEDSGQVDASLYQKLVGSLIWLMNIPVDIIFPVELSADFMNNPVKTHWHTRLHILRYIEATPDRNIFYSNRWTRQVVRTHEDPQDNTALPSNQGQFHA